MTSFDDVIAFLQKVQNPKKNQMNAKNRITPAAAKRLAKANPGVPDEYIAYLSEVGAGAFRECQFAVYDHLSPLADHIDIESLALEESVRLLVFGHNFSGDFTGFLPDEDWRIAEVWHDNGMVYRVDVSFGAYIRSRMLIGPNGEDLRNKSR